MNKDTQGVDSKLNTPPENAGLLVAGHADVAGERVGDAREKLTAALECGKEMYGRIRKQAIQGAKVADQTVRKNPYHAVGIALGVGAFIGYLVSCRRAHNGD